MLDRAIFHLDLVSHAPTVEVRNAAVNMNGIPVWGGTPRYPVYRCRRMQASDLGGVLPLASGFRVTAKGNAFMPARRRMF
jgi:hypothetical protein